MNFFSLLIRLPHMTLQSTVELNATIPHKLEIRENVLYPLDCHLLASSKNRFPE